MNLNDAKLAALTDQGFIGSINFATLQWLQANGAESPHLNDAWLEMLETVVEPGHRDDMWYELLGSLGYIEGHINDRELLFWLDGGVIGDSPPRWRIVPDGSVSDTALPLDVDMNQWVSGLDLRDWALAGNPAEITIAQTGVVTIAAGFLGTAVMDCTVENDIDARTSNIFEWTSVSVPVPPEWDTVPDQLVNEIDLPLVVDMKEYVTSLLPITAWDTTAFTIDGDGLLTVPDGTAVGSYPTIVEATNPDGPASSNTFNIVVEAEIQVPPEIDTQPNDLNVEAPDGGFFLVEASHPNDADLFYLWQANTGGGWEQADTVLSDVSGVFTDTMVVNTTEVDDTGQVRVLVRAYENTNDWQTISFVASLTVEAERQDPIINAQPNDVAVIEPEGTSFTVGASHPSSAPLFYEWEARNNEDTDWVDPTSVLSDVGGILTDTMVLGTTEEDDTRAVRCLVRAYDNSSDHEVASDSAELVVFPVTYNGYVHSFREGELSLGGFSHSRSSPATGRGAGLINEVEDNVPIFIGARYEDGVWYDEGVTKGLQVEDTGENHAIASTEWNDPAWEMTGMFETGNILEATEDDATVIQTLDGVTGDKVVAFDIGRVDGTGAIEIYSNGVWIPIYPDVVPRRWVVPMVGADAQFGLRIEEAGTSIDAAWSTVELADYVTSRIRTETTPPVEPDPPVWDTVPDMEFNQGELPITDIDMTVYVTEGSAPITFWTLPITVPGIEIELFAGDLSVLANTEVGAHSITAAVQDSNSFIVESEPFLVTVLAEFIPPVIDTQPEDQSVDEPGGFTIFCEASHSDDADLFYLWLAFNGSIWVNIGNVLNVPGAVDEPTLVVGSTVAGDDTTRMKCRVRAYENTDEWEVETDEAILSVEATNIIFYDDFDGPDGPLDGYNNWEVFNAVTPTASLIDSAVGIEDGTVSDGTWDIQPLADVMPESYAVEAIIRELPGGLLNFIGIGGYTHLNGPLNSNNVAVYVSRDILAWRIWIDSDLVSGPTDIEHDGVDGSLLRVEFTPSEVRIFMDGVLKDTITETLPNPIGSPSVHVIQNVALQDSGAIEDFKVMTLDEEPPPAEGLLLQYGFDEGSGTTALDTSGNDNHGEINNGSYTDDTPDGSDYSLALDSTYVRPDSDIDLTGEALTLCCWVKNATGGAADGRYITRSLGGSVEQHDWMFSKVDGTNLRSRIKLNGFVDTLIPNTGGWLVVGEWVHIALVYNGATIEMFADGISIQSWPATGTIAHTPGYVVDVGGQSTNSGFPSGQIDDARIYNRALSQEELEDIVGGGGPDNGELFNLTIADVTFDWYPSVDNYGLNQDSESETGVIVPGEFIPNNTHVINAFILSDEGSSKRINVRFTPPSLGIFFQSITIGFPDSGLDNISLSLNAEISGYYGGRNMEEHYDYFAANEGNTIPIILYYQGEP